MEPPPPTKKARLTAGSACGLCRRRKQRCDGRRPACSNCLSRDGGACCQYPSHTQNEATSPATSATTVAPSGLGTPQTSLKLSPSNGTCRQDQDDSAFYGDSSTFHFVSRLETASALESALPESTHRSTAPGNEEGNGVLGLSLGDEPVANHQTQSLPAELLHCLIDAYFERVHILYPYLHEPSFRTAWDAHQTTGSSPDAPADNHAWSALLNMVFAHGTQFVLQSAGEHDRMLLDAGKFALTARRHATKALSGETTLEVVQALLLLSHFLQGTTAFNDCWNVGGYVIRTAMSIGLHIDPAGSRLTEIDKQVRRRVWAGCFILDRTLSMKYGRPSSIPISIVERVEKPAAVDDQYITISTTRPRQPQSRPSMIDFLVSTIDQAYIIDAILNDLYLDDLRLHTAKDQADNAKTEVLSRLLSKAVNLEGRLQAWWDGLPGHLREAPEFVDGIVFVRQRCVMSMRFLHVRLLIHRQAFVVWSRFSNIQSQFLRDIAWSSSRLCVALACQTIEHARDNFDQQRLGPIWYTLHYVFTAVGILLHIGAARGDAGVLDGSPSNFSELRNWALTFLDRCSPSSTLAARYVSMLRHSERRLADRSNHRPMDVPGLTEGNLSLEDPFDVMTAFPDVDSTFLWTSDVSSGDPEAWRWDSGMWNIDHQALSQGF